MNLMTKEVLNDSRFMYALTTLVEGQRCSVIYPMSLIYWMSSILNRREFQNGLKEELQADKFLKQFDITVILNFDQTVTVICELPAL